jgi:hypothetical protein
MNYITFYTLDTFPAFSIHLKKPSGGPKGLIGPPCHGAPWPAEAFLFIMQGIDRIKS